MKLISFDIGIKNMAYCILTHDSSETHIIDWKVLNLLDQPTETPVFCTCILAKSLKITKKQKLLNVANHVVNEPVQCGKSAKFQKVGIFYCEKHAKLNTNYFIPKKIWSPVSLKKMKNEDLLKMCEEHKIQLTNSTTKLLKKTILEKMDAFFQDKCYEPIKVILTKTSSETDLITIGRNMKTEMDKLEHLEGISHVIMENQISPIANRMKCIQGMLAQYFIMKYDRQVHIEFVSSVNKLRFLEKQNTNSIPTSLSQKQNPNNLTNEVISTDNPINENLTIDKLITDSPGKFKSTKNSIRTADLHSSWSMTDKEMNPSTEGADSNLQRFKSTYKEHKLDGVYYTGRILEQNEGLKSWKDALSTKKKDDLADCFLQGIWYMNHKDLLCINDKFSINNIPIKY
jgi:hypothetical protein